MKITEFRKLIREEVRKALSEADLAATGDGDIKLIITYLNSIGIKPVYPRHFIGSFNTKREIDVELGERSNKPFTKEYEALKNDQAKFRQVLQKANVPNKPVLVSTYQDKFGSYSLNIVNTDVRGNLEMAKRMKDPQYFILK